jgi:hypothetical protein
MNLNYHVTCLVPVSEVSMDDSEGQRATPDPTYESHLSELSIGH